MTKLKVSIVGTGPGAPEYVTPAARKAVQAADIIIGAQRSLTLFSSDIRGEAVKLTAKNLHEILQYASESAQKGKNVAILSTGDPGFSGLLRTFLNSAISQHVEVDVIPGISSIQVCASRLGICWDDAGLFTFHEKKAQLIQMVKAGKMVMLFPNPKTFTPKEIANFLISNGLAKGTTVFICENLTLPDEKVIRTTLEEASTQEFSPLCVMAIKSVQ
jgi:cobalt-precorrin-7 (C5)-methyltransferase